MSHTTLPKVAALLGAAAATLVFPRPAEAVVFYGSAPASVTKSNGALQSYTVGLGSLTDLASAPSLAAYPDAPSVVRLGTIGGAGTYGKYNVNLSSLDYSVTFSDLPFSNLLSLQAATLIVPIDGTGTASANVGFIPGNGNLTGTYDVLSVGGSSATAYVSGLGNAVYKDFSLDDQTYRLYVAQHTTISGSRTYLMGAIQQTPEPGALAMLLGSGVTGGLMLRRRVKG